jgi:hypothetical protein
MIMTSMTKLMENIIKISNIVLYFIATFIEWESFILKLIISMSHEIILHISEFLNEREFIQTEVERNLSGKLDAYLKKIAQENDKIRVELSLDRSKKGINGKLHIILPGTTIISEREDFGKLEDLINHLFSHIKDQLAK